jgi:hypothetical protein
MKTFSFIAGHPDDPTRGMLLAIDRSRVPADMKLGMYLDDDGKQIPGFDRAAARRAALAAHGAGPSAFVLLERTRIHAKLCGVEGVLTVEPGTRFDVNLGGELGALEIEGGELTMREGRRYADLKGPRPRLTLDKRPNAAHVFTLVAEKPPGANPGDLFFVEVTQLTRTGDRQGAVAVNFTFD